MFAAPTYLLLIFTTGIALTKPINHWHLRRYRLVYAHIAELLI
jgi:hypothetical protein